MRNFLICFLFTCLIQGAKAQIIEQNDLYNLISAKIHKSYKKPDPQKIIVFSVFLSTNSKGIVDSVFFSNPDGPTLLEDIVDVKEIKQKYIAKKFKTYGIGKSLIVMPVMIRVLGDIKATYLTSLGIDYANLFNVTDTKSKKNIILCKPTVVSFSTTEDM